MKPKSGCLYAILIAVGLCTMLVVVGFLVIVVLFGAATAVPCKAATEEKAAESPPEPDAELADAWWPQHRNVWTPIGWKDHLFRFNVLYNGTVIAQPHPRTLKRFTTERRLTAKWEGMDVRLTFTPSYDGEIPAWQIREPYQLISTADRGIGNQGWTDNPTPLLWTEWPLSEEGLVLRKEVFAHIPGARAVESGIEPLYAWIRLSISHIDELSVPENFSFVIQLGGDHFWKKMSRFLNLRVFPELSPYPHKLTAKPFSQGGGEGLRIVENNGNVRLAAIPSDSVRFRFRARENKYSAARRPVGLNDYFLIVDLPVQKGVHADLLLPMIPGSRDEVDAEMELGFEKALGQSDRFWSVVPETAARIVTPERRINEAIAKSVKFSELIAEKNPETGEYSFLSSSWHYDTLWPTPQSMVSHMMLDNLGYHQVVERHIEFFKKNQGTVKPPGPSYGLHPGYLTAPERLTYIPWLSDHGATLYAVCRHALLTGDREFIDRWQEAIVKACEFIKEARARTDHDGTPGVLPPAVATDRIVPTQSGWNIGWNYKGLCSAVRLLKQIGHPRAEEFAREAHDYKNTFIKALREQVKTARHWTDREGKKHPIVPLSLSAGGDNLHAFYLDTGPLFLVWSGLMEADDPLMRSTLAFFREGPNTKVYDPRGNCWQRPILIHEISSCEPVYSWNIYHSWQLGDRHRFLEGMYSLLAAGLSRQTYVNCETLHGIYGNVMTSPLLIDLIRLSVIDDQIAEDELHLLRLAPLAWLRTDHQTRFENMPTEFGPVTITFKLAAQGEALEISYRSLFRHRPKKVVLHVPPVAGLARVIINGRPVRAGPGELLSLE